MEHLSNDSDRVKTKVLGEITVPVSLSLQQIWYELAWNWTWTIMEVS